MKKEKSSAAKFGGIIDAYTISEAEADGVVLPLIYQPRYVELSVQQKLLDQFYDTITKDLGEEQKKDLQQKFSSSQILEETSQRIETIALDILNHYSRFADTGLKAQVVAPSKYAAVMFQKAFELCRGDMHVARTAVIISESADKEEDDQLAEHKKEVVRFLAEEKHRYGSSLLKREKDLIDDFRDNPDGVRMLIVVDKLLTGFDAPRNTFLYSRKTARICLNLALIKASRHQIDYVLTHELCHITHTAHDKAFYRLLSSHLPDWKKVKSELEQQLLS